MTLIQFVCPQCEETLEMEAEWAGHTVACPSCSAQVKMPTTQDQLAAKVPASKSVPGNSGSGKARRGGGGFFKFLLLVLLLAVGGFLYYCYSTHQPPEMAWHQVVEQARQYVSPAPSPAPPAPAPAPAPAVQPAPPPVVVAPATKPVPATNVVVAPAPPLPPPDPIAWLAGEVKQHPVEISLLADTTFPIIYNGKVVGSGNVPRGNPLQIISIDEQAKQVTLSSVGYGGSTMTVPIAATDLDQRARDIKMEIEEEEEAGKGAAAQVAATKAAVEKAAAEKAAVAPVAATNVVAFVPAPSANANETPVDAAGSPEPNDQVQIEETITDGFRHPGIGLTKAMLENARAQIIAKRNPWYSGYVRMATNRNAAEQVSPSKPGSDTFDNRGMVGRLGGDADKAFRQALMYYFTGKEVYRANAMNIIRIWSKLDPQKFRSFSEDHIHACYPVQNMIRAAELMRYTSSPGEAVSWTDQDTEVFTKNFVVPAVATFFSKNGWFMNQAGYPIAAAMAGDIFTNNREDYATRVEWFTVNKDAPNKGWSYSIKDLARLVDTNAVTGEKVATPQVQLMEMGRDQAHAGDDVEIFTNVARMMNAQGTKVDPVDGTISTKENAVGPYEFLNDRILAAADYFCRFMLGYDTPWIPVPYDIDPDGKVRRIYPRIADNYRGRIREFEYWDLYYYYTCQKGVNLAVKAPYFYEGFTKRIVNSEMDWVYIPAQASGEGAALQQPEQEPAAVKIFQRSTLLDAKAASIVREADTTFVRVTPAEAGTRIALLSMGTSKKTIQMRVRTTGVAQIAISGFAKPWLLPDTKGEWRYVSYTMAAIEPFRDIEFFTIKSAPGTQVDLDQLIRDGDLKAVPAFKDGSDDLNIVAYVGAPITLDFPPASTDANTTVGSLDKPEGSTLDGATGNFSWTPKQQGDYPFVVNLANGETMAANRVHIIITPDRASALQRITAAYDDKIGYVCATAEKYQASLAEAKSASSASDEVFFAKLRQLQEAAADLQPLTPLLADGSMNFPKVVASSNIGEWIGVLTDGNNDTFIGSKDLHFIFDFGPQFRFSATAFALQGRLNFEDRSQNITFYGSNDGESWTPLTAVLDKLPTELCRVEVINSQANAQFRYLKVEKPNALFEPSELRIYGQRYEAQ